jgi:hypothetical protein
VNVFAFAAWSIVGKSIRLKASEFAFEHHNINSSNNSSRRISLLPSPDFLWQSPAQADAAPQMAPQGGRGRGRANRAPAKRGGWRTARTHSSGPHNREGLIVTLHLRAPQPAHQLPTPESTNLSLNTPASPQEPAEQVIGEGEEQFMAPVRDPNNVDGTRPREKFAGLYAKRIGRQIKLNM